MHFNPVRRALLALMAAAAVPAAWATGGTVAVLYRPETPQSAPRTDPAVGTAVGAIQGVLKRQGLTVVLAPPDVERLLADNPHAPLTFDNPEDVVVLVDLLKSQRPYERGETWADANLRVRVYRGREVAVAPLDKTGRVAFGPGAERQGFDEATRRAVRALGNDLGEGITTAMAQAPLPGVGGLPGQSTAANGTPGGPGSTPPAVSPAADGPPLVPEGKRWALLVGVADFSEFNRRNRDSGVSAMPLPNVANDLVLMRQTLGQLGFEKPVELLNERATTASLRQALADLRSKVGPKDMVFFYLATHGAAADGRYSQFGQPLLYDTDYRSPTPYDFERIKTDLKALPAAHLVWALDTCHSGGALRGETVVRLSARQLAVAAPNQPRGLSPALAVADMGKNLAVLSSAHAEQLSWEHPRQKNGLFTAQLGQALAQTQGKLGMARLFSEHLEAQVPALAREIKCQPGLTCPVVQQPGVAFAGQGGLLALR